jgi:hypothetical protein
MYSAQFWVMTGRYMRELRRYVLESPQNGFAAALEALRLDTAQRQDRPAVRAREGRYRNGFCAVAR